MTNIEKMMRDVRLLYEKEIGYDVPDDSRKSLYVQDRVALSNAWRPYTTFKNIGAVFGKDHSTVVHYCKEHEPMMNFYPSYNAKYDIALSLTQDVAQQMAIAPQVSTTSRRHLRSELDVIKNTIKNLKVLEKKMEIILADKGVLT